jgi:hypothetical protein
VPDLDRISLCRLHVPESGAEIVEGSVSVLVAEALGGPLKPQGAEIEELNAVRGLGSVREPLGSGLG